MTFADTFLQAYGWAWLTIGFLLALICRIIVLIVVDD